MTTVRAIAPSSHRTVRDLNGVWLFAPDPANVGKDERWMSGPERAPSSREVVVPSVWEETLPDYDGVAWYWRDFTLEQAELRSASRLRFGAVSYFAEVWLNGEFVGSHEGGFTPFELGVAACLRSGTNRITVRVVSPPKDERGIDGFVLKETPCWRQLESFNFGGIWQDVELHLLPAYHILDCFVRPHRDSGAVDVHLEIANSTGAAATGAVRVQVLHALAAEVETEAFASATCPAGISHHTLRLSLPHPQLWSPASPTLYVATALLSVTERVDGYQVRFGIRDLDLSQDGFRLNGVPIFVKGGFHEGIYPGTIVRPHDEAIVRKELAEAKAAGLNLLRFWQIPAHPRVLDLADEMGVMLSEGPPIGWLTDSPAAERRCRQEVRDLVRRDRNRPSVVLWEILNEGGILPDFTRTSPAEFTPDQWVHSTPQRLRKELCLEARALDPSRLIIDDSGGWVTGANMYAPDSVEPVSINDIHIYRGAPVTEATYDELATLGGRDAPWAPLPYTVVNGGKPTYVSEFGYGSFADFPRLLSAYRANGVPEDAEDFVQVQRVHDSLASAFEKLRLKDLFPSLSAVCEATQALQADGNRLQMEALRSNPNVAGYVIHAFSAGGLVLCGEMVDLWREPKPVCAAAALVHRELHPVIRVWPRVVRVNRPMPIQVTVVSDHVPFGPAEVETRLIGTDGERVIATVPFTATARVTPLRSVSAGPLQTPGGYIVRVSVRRGRAKSTSAELTVLVVDEPPWSTVGGAVRVIEPSDDRRFSFFLVSRGVALSDDTRCIVVAVPAKHWGHEPYREQIEGALAAVDAGATVLFVTPIEVDDAPVAREYLPWIGEIHPAIGHWIPVAHYVRAHALFAELPGPGLMEWPYANTSPSAALVDPSVDEIPAGCLSLHATIWERPERAWAGADVAIRRQGQGRVLLSQMRILGNLAADPIADRLLFNYLVWGVGG
ncbi:MAG: hypothetical protein EPO26_00155 [Chloroflexota bacterium]|nr:MAG: hypothetical protein EPO26_00155 [Chloroflexota bacterium]